MFLAKVACYLVLGYAAAVAVAALAWRLTGRYRGVLVLASLLWPLAVAEVLKEKKYVGRKKKYLVRRG
ncbi:hypothetical protein [Desulfovirgula thermocuniculi]|uniref:hypothetical protein n=1 Tax=Desulfovirgula thermocuniculi TaxID=348842 RepID=UPI000405D9F9|nr:hypothetical protein [Desulfovirgula thermocuniculi]